MPTRTLLEKGGSVSGTLALYTLVPLLAYNAAFVTALVYRAASRYEHPRALAVELAFGAVTQVVVAQRVGFSLLTAATPSGTSVHDMLAVRGAAVRLFAHASACGPAASQPHVFASPRRSLSVL